MSFLKYLSNHIIFTLSHMFYMVAEVVSKFWIMITATLIYVSAILLYNQESLIFFILYLCVVIFGIYKGRKRFQYKTRKIIKRELELSNKVTIGSLEILSDERAIGNQDYWRHTLKTVSTKIPFFFPKFYNNKTSHQDPYALRFIACLVFVFVFFTSTSQSKEAFLSNIIPSFQLSALVEEEIFTYSGWITPPHYTGQAPIILNEETDDLLLLTEGSQLQLSMTSSKHEKLFLSLGFENNQPLQKKDQNFIFNGILTEEAQEISIMTEDNDVLISWNLFVEEDTEPLISYLKDPQRKTGSNVQITYAIQDDFIPKTVRLKIEPIQSSPIYISADPIYVEMPIGVQTNEDVKTLFEADILYDFSNNILSGSPVLLSLEVFDQIDQIGSTESYYILLPKREFTNETAKKLIALREKLITSYKQERVNSLMVIENILIRPYLYKDDRNVFLNLKALLTRLYLDDKNTQLLSTTNLLWQIAVHIEDGALFHAQNALKNVQKDLLEALNSDLSDEILEQLINELEKSLNLYAQKSIEEMIRNLENKNADLSQFQASMINPKKAKEFFEQMRKKLANGDKNSLRQMMQDLQNMLSQMKAPPPELSPEQQKAFDLFQELQDITDTQESLITQTKKLQIVEDNDYKALKLLIKTAQEENKIKLDTIILSLKELLPNTPFELLEQASGLMDMAVKTLKEDDVAQALSFKIEALNKLNQGLEDTQRAIQQELQLNIQDSQNSLKSLMGFGIQQGRMQQNSNQDPFGRDVGQNESFEGNLLSKDQENYKKTRQIIKELQKRSSDLDRPLEERNYIKRLLERF